MPWGVVENSLNLSILLSERKEIKWDILSNGEWKEYSSNLNPFSLTEGGIVSLVQFK